jgi:hypothetical protein
VVVARSSAFSITIRPVWATVVLADSDAGDGLTAGAALGEFHIVRRFF